ncbi:MAG: PP2C family protein-serine/threonine phosphatase [Fluviicola sp.]|jgi:serine phosphatase RsbU (regulator of sigma subunit)
MLKKLGISFLIVFPLVIAVAILFNASLPKPLFFGLFMLSAVCIPLGASFWAMFTNERKRKNIKLIFLIISLSLVVLSYFVLRNFQIPGTAITGLVGIFWYCFAFAPMQLSHNYRKWKPYLIKKIETVLLVSLDFVSMNFIALGLLFKYLHWPFANILIYSGAIILLVALFFWNFKFKKEVVLRKLSEDELKIKHQEITDSINYAKRIQSAILPSDRLISELLPNSFVLYLPKDVVAGDFYWLEKTENEILFAVADCTGHGVPGAMVSVVCNNALNRVVKEYKLTIPGEILDKTRSLIIEEFEKSEEEVKDGMDIALCSIVGDKLSYAGAHNPLVIIRNGELIEIKANKQPIGKYDKIQAFTTHEVQLQKGDRIYLFSDGYIDQFGGEFGKKLKSKYFKEILLANQNKSIKLQKDAFELAFQNWKGNYEQIDDVCLIGIEF